MKLHQLQALLALADEGGIRAAARALDLSQAAVTKALRESGGGAGTDPDLAPCRLRDQALDQASLCFIDCLRRTLKACVRSPQGENRRLAGILNLQF